MTPKPHKPERERITYQISQYTTPETAAACIDAAAGGGPHLAAQSETRPPLGVQGGVPRG